MQVLGGMPVKTLLGKEVMIYHQHRGEVIRVIRTSSFIRISSSGGGEIGSLVSSTNLS